MDYIQIISPYTYSYILFAHAFDYDRRYSNVIEKCNALSNNCLRLLQLR